MKTLLPGALTIGALVVPFLLAGTCAAAVTMLPGGGPKKTDCMVQLAGTGTAFPESKKRPRGVTCADGDACDQDGERNGVCEFSTSVCINTPNEALERCDPSFEVLRTTISGADSEVNDALEGALLLPSTTQDCTEPVAVNVAVRGPNKKGEFKSGKLKIRLQAKARGENKDKDKYQLVCRPGAPIPPVEEEPPVVTPVPPASPGKGLDAQILDATVSAEGVVTVTFRLTDAEGKRVEPTGSSTDDPNQARVRFAIARIEPDSQTEEGFTTAFTRYVNYLTRTQKSPITGESSEQPTYDSNGTFAVLDAEAGTYTYTFGTLLPAGFPATLTHTVGAQIERVLGGEDLVANPIFDFVPAGGPVVTTREGTTTAQCNACHDPLAVHGAGRREVRLCQLCHTDQSVDPDTGNAIDLKVMVHKIHRGKELPSIGGGPVGTKYSIIGFNQSEHVYGEKVNVCKGGEHASAPCTSDDDCPGSTCSGEGTAGVGFPQDIRNCEKCHAEGETAANYAALPSTPACAACHDDVNPGETPTRAGAPGTGHLAGAQPEAFCRICHVPAGEEFGISVVGAHTVPARSEQLAGLGAEILSAWGAPGGPLTMTFRLSDGAGTPVDTLVGFNRVALIVSGPTTDFGGASVPLISATIAGAGASGTLSGPDAAGVFTYVSAGSLPSDAVGSWRVGLEARRSVTLEGDGTVTEAAQNPVFDFSVDGSSVVSRREVVDIAKCGDCHGVFSKDFSIHGSLRNQTEYCVICHNPEVTDFERRSPAVGTDGANPLNESINLKHLIHKIHTGEELEQKPYIVYGRGSPFTPHEFSEVLYPGDRRNCATCHVNESYLLPLPESVLPTMNSVVDTTTTPFKEVKIGATPPTQDACLSCHDGDAVRIHAQTQTTAAGEEACLVCHGEGKISPVSEAHATGS